MAKRKYLWQVVCCIYISRNESAVDDSDVTPMGKTRKFDGAGTDLRDCALAC